VKKMHKDFKKTVSKFCKRNPEMPSAKVAKFFGVKATQIAALKAWNTMRG